MKTLAMPKTSNKSRQMDAGLCLPVDIQKQLRQDFKNKV
jgi:hypothetical protein